MSSAGTPRSEDKLGCDLKSLLKLKKKYDAPAEAELPATYRTNSDKERLWLWCANNMLRQIKETPLKPTFIFVLVVYIHLAAKEWLVWWCVLDVECRL